VGGGDGVGGGVVGVVVCLLYHYYSIITVGDGGLECFPLYYFAARASLCRWAFMVGLC